MSKRPKKTTPKPNLHGIELTRDALHLEDRLWFRGVKTPSRQGPGSEIFVPLKDIHRPAQLQDFLVGQGFDLPMDRATRTQLLTDLAAYKPSAECALTGRQGWHGDTYVLAFESIGSKGSEEIVFYGHVEVDRNDASRGTKRRWKELVAGPAAASTLVVFAICVAFAPVLMRFAPSCESGIFHFHGETSKGKSTVVAVAASVWRGGPAPLDTWNTTLNALHELFAKRNDGLICLDEITLFGGDKKTLRNLVQQAAHLTTQGKARQRSALYVGQAAPTPYRFLAVSNGEKAVAAITAEAGERRMKGEEARFIDIPIPSDETGVIDRLESYQPDRSTLTSGEIIEALKEAVKGCYGTVGPAFVRHIVRDLKGAQDKVTEYTDEFIKKMGVSNDGWERRIAMKFALAYAAGRMAIEAKLVPWDVKLVRVSVARAYRWAREELKSDHDRAVDTLAQLQGLAAGSGLVDLIAPERRPTEEEALDAKVLRSQHKGQIEILISRKVFEAIGDSAARRLLLGQLEQAGVFRKPKCSTPRKVQERTVVRGKKRRWFYVFTEALLTHELPSASGEGH